MQSLHILLDGYNLGLDKGTGVATYARNLSTTLSTGGAKVSVLYGKQATKSHDPLLGEIAFFDGAKQGPGKVGPLRMVREAMLAPLGCGFDTIKTSGAVIHDTFRSTLPYFDHLLNSPDLYRRCARTFRWFDQFARVRVPSVNVAHWTYPLPIAAVGAANVYTLHDLVPLRLPHTTLDHKRRYLKLCRRLVKSADHIVTVSEASKRDIVNLLGVDESRVTNTYQAVSFPESATRKTVAEVTYELKGIFGLDYKAYFLFFGAIEPKKNLGRLIEAYLASGVDTPLVIVGAPGWKSDDELRLLNSLKALPANRMGRRRIVQLEYLPFALLVSMIRGAKATIFPSLYEGFGLPVLESMHLGTAVITSNTSSLPELCGDAACMIDPYDTASIVGAIRAVDADDNLRIGLEQKGKKQARFFSVDAFRQKLSSVYEAVVNSRR